MKTYPETEEFMYRTGKNESRNNGENVRPGWALNRELELALRRVEKFS